MKKIVEYCFKYCNYLYLPENLDQHYLFFYLCLFSYTSLVKKLLDNKDININVNEIQKLNIFLNFNKFFFNENSKK